MRSDGVQPGHFEDSARLTPSDYRRHPGGSAASVSWGEVRRGASRTARREDFPRKSFVSTRLHRNHKPAETQPGSV